MTMTGTVEIPSTATAATTVQQPKEGTAPATTVVAQQPQQTIVVQSTGPQPPPGAPAGGSWIQENYCGTGSWVIGLCLGCWCIAFCPVDSRTVYAVDGRKFNMMGAQII